MFRLKVSLVDARFLGTNVVCPYRSKHPFKSVGYQTASGEKFVHCPRSRGKVNYFFFQKRQISLQNKLLPPSFLHHRKQNPTFRQSHLSVFSLLILPYKRSIYQLLVHYSWARFNLLSSIFLLKSYPIAKNKTFQSTGDDSPVLFCAVSPARRAMENQGSTQR